MGLRDELGQVKEGYLADLLLADGDPMKDLHLRLSPLCSRTTTLPHRPSGRWIYILLLNFDDLMVIRAEIDRYIDSRAVTDARKRA